ncbi:MAG: enoyl-CoA hydratase/isomerase family protein [Anaerolineae bacterium]|nr:enoyl-CoA hydratase/isomerase family protein [Anaerolineae bacterium]
MTYDTIRLDERDNALILYFNRPDKLNAINARMFTELGQLLDSIASGGRAVNALILTGEGRAFVAGADIGPYAEMSLPEFTAFQRLGRSIMEKLERLPCPVIAAVNGYAFGGGFELALAADIIIASENAKFALPEAKLGLLPGGGGTQRLARIVGPYIAKRLIMAAETITAQRAYELNLVTQITPPGEVVQAALALAQHMKDTCGPLAIRMAKRLIDEGLQAPLATALSMEMDTTALLFPTEDKREGIQAFIEKRPPQFKGR